MPKKSDIKRLGKVEKSKKTARKSEKLPQEQFEKKVLELAEKGLTAEKIGEELRQQGIHPKEHNKKISDVLKEKKKYIIPELKNMEEKLKKIIVHCEKNKQDKKAIREKERISAQIRRIKEYFKI